MSFLHSRSLYIISITTQEADYNLGYFITSIYFQKYSFGVYKWLSMSSKIWLLLINLRCNLILFESFIGIPIIRSDLICKLANFLIYLFFSRINYEMLQIFSENLQIRKVNGFYICCILKFSKTSTILVYVNHFMNWYFFFKVTSGDFGYLFFFTLSGCWFYSKNIQKLISFQFSLHGLLVLQRMKMFSKWKIKFWQNQRNLKNFLNLL